MWKDETVTLVLPTYRERGSIRRVLADFVSTGLVDDVVVVDNNAEPGTHEEIVRAGCDRIEILREERQGFGYALRRGLAAAGGDLVVMAEPDGTYVGRDLRRFLTLSEDYPVVLGSRTIQRTSNKDWGFWRREANIACGMAIHLMFGTHLLTDIGCTYKLLRREVIERLAPGWSEGSSLFATELLLSVITAGIGFVETPVTFQERVGESSVLSSRLALARLTLRAGAQILATWGTWAYGQTVHRRRPRPRAS